MRAARIDHRVLRLPRLPFWAAVFVSTVCIVIVALGGWREWTSRTVELTNAEVDMANLARSLTQHAEDTIELADASVVGLVGRLETDGAGPASIAKSSGVPNRTAPSTSG